MDKEQVHPAFAIAFVSPFVMGAQGISSVLLSADGNIIYNIIISAVVATVCLMVVIGLLQPSIVQVKRDSIVFKHTRAFIMGIYFAITAASLAVCYLLRVVDNGQLIAFAICAVIIYFVLNNSLYGKIKKAGKSTPPLYA